MKKIIIILVVIVAILIAYYLISPLFIKIEVQEEAPQVEEGQEIEKNEVIGTSGHPASGTVSVIGDVIRYEDFMTINGPKLHVYLSKDLEAKEYIDLGPIKGTEGNINYNIPENIDISGYKYVMYWCVPFRVLFNYAEI